MSLTEADLVSGPGEPPSAARGSISARSRWRSRWWWLLVPGVLAVTALVVATVLAATYQPIAYGSDSGIGSFPGLPDGSGLRYVNNFGGLSEDLFIPPQRNTFTIDISIMNTGSRAVIIEGVTLPRLGQGFWPLTPAGPAQYYRAQGAVLQPPVHVLRNVTLGPGQEIIIGIPVRTWPCAQKHGWTSVPWLYVRERFLVFTHTVSLPFGRQGDHLIMHNPGGHQGEPDIFCAGH